MGVAQTKIRQRMLKQRRRDTKTNPGKVAQTKIRQRMLKLSPQGANLTNKGVAQTKIRQRMLKLLGRSSYQLQQACSPNQDSPENAET